MSGVMKSIGKTFKKIVKSPAKLIASILAVGAIVFTAGAALGLAPLAGGWGGAVAGVFGTNSTIGSVLTGAVTQAGYGAAIGGVVSAATGGDFGSGAAQGAVVGGIGGALMGGMGMGTDIFASGAGAGGAPTAASGAGAAPQAAGVAQSGVASAGASVGGVAPAAGGATGLGSILSSPVIGNAIAGGAQGLMTGLAAKDQAKAADKEQKRKTDSYTLAADNMDKSPLNDPTVRPKPGEAFAQQDAGKYVFNRDTGQIEYQPTS
jgi:hypothetical protein